MPTMAIKEVERSICINQRNKVTMNERKENCTENPFEQKRLIPLKEQRAQLGDVKHPNADGTFGKQL